MIGRLLLYVTNLVLGLVELFITIRVLLKLFGASTVAPFVRWVYETTDSLIAPFVGMFPSPVLEGGLVIDFSALFALLVYAFIGYLIMEIVHELMYRSRRRVLE